MERTDNAVLASSEGVFNNFDALVPGLQMILVDVLVSDWLKMAAVERRFSEAWIANEQNELKLGLGRC